MHLFTIIIPQEKSKTQTLISFVNFSPDILMNSKYIVDVVEGAGRKAKRMVLQCINGVGSNPVEGRKKI